MLDPKNRIKPLSQVMSIFFLLLVLSSFQDTSSNLSLNKTTDRSSKQLNATIQRSLQGGKPAYTLSVLQTLDEGFILAGAPQN